MCGIAGIARFDGGAADASDVARMSGALAHRGPAGDGIYTAENVLLAHRRLAIIDPATGQQPFVDEEAGLALTYNGEVYNYLEVRRELGGTNFHTNSDTEVVLRAYARWGIGCVQKFRGMFAFAIHDRRARRLYLVRDRLGIKPLYFHIDESRLAFASELGALMQGGGVDCEIDDLALSEYLRFGYVPTPLTIYRDVRKLEPGCYLEVDLSTGKASQDRYWTLSPSPRAHSAAQATEELNALLDEVIKLYVRSDVAFGAFLSGGVDSSLVTALMSRVLDEPVRSFAIGYEEEALSELPYAEKAARIVGANHTSAVLSPQLSEQILLRITQRFGEPFADSSAIPTWYVSNLAARHVKMVLSGDGGDELFAGYNSYGAVLDTVSGKAGRNGGFLRRGARWLAGRVGMRRDVTDWREAHHRQRDTFSREQRAGLLGRSVPVAPDDELERPSDLDPVTRCQLRDVHTYLLDDILTKVDRMSMDNSLEVRVPLLDHTLVEFAFGLPTDLKIGYAKDGQIETKRLLKASAARFYPREMLDRRKQGFGIPVHQWLAGPLKEMVLDLLDHGASALAPRLDGAAVRAVVRDYYRGRLERGGEVWNLLAFRLWMDGCLKPSSTA